MLFAPKTEREPNAEQMVDALNATFGRHPHVRASHAKGFCVTGSFIASSNASEFSGSAIFGSGKHPAVVRFSIAGGNPHVADKAPAARGMAVDIDAQGGQGLTLVMISTPMFFAASAESFVSFLEARRPDPDTGKPDPTKIEISNRIHLDSEAQRRWLSAVPPSASYATSPYFAVHTYMFETLNGMKQPGRWIFEPIAGRIGLSKDELQTKPDSFLDEELKQRLAIGQVEWKVLLQLPEAIDPLLNPTVAWPESRKTIELGRLVLDREIDSALEAEYDERVFDPSRLPHGIESARDPVFALRSEVYAVSHARRVD